LIYLPKSNIIFISKKTVPQLDPEKLKSSLVAANCFQNARSIAISATHAKCWSFIQGLKNYESLELVFIVLEQCTAARERRWGVDGNDDLVDTRLSCKEEILFEVLHERYIWSYKYQIPGQTHGLASR
jgi:hypothetical protein